MGLLRQGSFTFSGWKRDTRRLHEARGILWKGAIALHLQTFVGHLSVAVTNTTTRNNFWRRRVYFANGFQRGESAMERQGHGGKKHKAHRLKTTPPRLLLQQGYTP